eukprot:gene37526-49112_t
MSGIAEVLFNLGYRISGSDLADSATLRRLQGLGIQTCLGHAAAHIDGADAVVTSTAVTPDNPEVLAAREKKIPVVPRALMLAELMRLKQGIAIAGTHGKTTTTSLVTSVLAEAGLDPTFVIGGKLNSAGANAKLGSGDYIVVEADESDASFLNLLPVMAVVTNIDADHMETYGHDFGRLKQAFVDFLHRMPFYGTAILCTDDPAVRAIVDEVSCPITSYGFDEGAQVRATQVRPVGSQMHFTVTRRNGVVLPDLEVVLNLPGEHNVRNALAAIAAARHVGVPIAQAAESLARFESVKRRMEVRGVVKGVTVYDDFAHHPTAIATTVGGLRQKLKATAAAAASPASRILAVLEPRPNTMKLGAMKDALPGSLAEADLVFGFGSEKSLGWSLGAALAPLAGADYRRASLAEALRDAPAAAASLAPRLNALAGSIKPDSLPHGSGHQIGGHRADFDQLHIVHWCQAGGRGGEGEEAVAIERRVDRADGPRQPALRHHRHPQCLGAGERRIGGDRADDRVVPPEAAMFGQFWHLHRAVTGRRISINFAETVGSNQRANDVAIIQHARDAADAAGPAAGPRAEAGTDGP